MSRSPALTAFAAALVLTAVVPAAHASMTSRAVHLSGLEIMWPTASVVSVAPGTTFSVTVRPTAAAGKATRAKLSLAGLGSRGNVLDVVRRQSVRNGRFTATVPAVKPRGTYALKLSVGAVTRSVAVRVVAASAPPCTRDPAATSSASVHVQPSVIGAGDPLTVSIQNTGGNGLGYGAGVLEWQRADAAGWTTIPDLRAHPDILYCLRPEETKSFGAVTPPTTLTPGHYRINATLQVGSFPNVQAVTASAAEFDVQ